MYLEAAQSRITVDGILNVLRFSDKWDAPGVQAYCITHLNRTRAMKLLHPVLEFSIARKFNQPSWVRDALTGIQQTPISTWINNTTILSWMVPHDMIVILRLREHASSSRLELIRYRPSAVHTSNCKNLDQCSFHWDLSWAFSVVPRMAHKTFAPVDVYLFIKEMEVKDMGEGCAEASKEAALRSSMFFADMDGVRKAIRLLDIKHDA